MDQSLQSIKHLISMLDARGDNTEGLKEQSKSLNSDDFKRAEYLELNSENTQIFYCLNKFLIKSLVKLLKDTDAASLIDMYEGRTQFIVVKSATQTNQAIFEEKDKELYALDKNAMFQAFDIRHLLYDPSLHAYVPKHEKLSSEEITDILTLYTVKSRFQLPIILKTDIMARYLGLRHGDVVRIHRINPNSGLALYYRCVM